jgi:3-deoxy-D-manno-octulosonic-acid transferase
MKLIRFAYNFVLILLLPYILFHLIWRSHKQPAYLENLGERFGIYPQPVSEKVIWLHAVSVGETRAAAPLIKALKQSYPDHQIVLTCMTPTGRETGKELFKDTVTQCYLPYDYPFAVRGFLNHFKPQICLLMETELWLNVIEICHRKNIPALLVNARMSQKSANKYHIGAKLTRYMLQRLQMVAAQTQSDAERLKTLGAEKIEITGNLKFDITPPDETKVKGEALRQSLGANKNIFLIASTREGEEVLILDALDKNPLQNTLVILVPRHPQRFEEIAKLLQKRNILFHRRSDPNPIPNDIQIFFGDSMGEMFVYYHACDLAFIGGSLLRFGAQNLIEACSVGKPVLIGEYTYNFAEATLQAIEKGAAIRIFSADELMKKASALLKDKDALRKMGDAGLEFSREHRGATERLVKIVKHYYS